jgi:hypothetical protein
VTDPANAPYRRIATEEAFSVPEDAERVSGVAAAS